MKTTVKTIKDGKFEVTCEIDEKVWQDAQKKAENKMMANVQIKGFRKGHVPADIAKKHINAGEMFNEAINIVLPDAFAQAMEENKLRPFTRPQVAVDKFSTTSLTIKFTVVTAPKVTLGKYKDIKIAKGEVKVTDEEVDKAIKDLLHQNAELVVKNGTAEKGDTVIIDFEGFVDDKPFEGGKASNYELKLGSGQFIPGFEDQLIGTKANDKKDVNVTFPEQYVENLKGKKATFKCTVHEVKQEKIPELNDETVKGLKIEKVDNVAKLKEHQKDNLTKRKANEVENKYYNDLVEKITADSKVTVADEIIDEEAHSMKDNLKRQVEQNGMKWEQYIQITGQKEDEMDKKMKEQAAKNIKAMLVLTSIMDQEKITVTEEEKKNEFKRIADLYKMDVKKVEELLGKDMANFENQLKSKKLHDFLVSVNK